MKTKHFKSRHALLMSLTSLTLCVSMLFGATFAWFTDSVTSGVNRIVSGNLDVELTHTNGSVQTAEPVTATTQLFNEAYTNAEGPNYQLWEPGAMAYETFTVTNAGSLALKYQLSLSDIVKNTVKWGENDTEYDLTEVVKVGVFSGEVTRDAVKAAATNSITDTGYIAKTAALEPGASETFTVALYWAPNDNAKDNLYNLRSNSGYELTNPGTRSDTQLFIESKITLLATQYTSEADSFDNQYDVSALAGENADVNITIKSVRATATAKSGEETVISAGSVGGASGTKATISANAVAADSEITLVVEESENTDAVATIEAADGTAMYFDVSLEDEEGAEVELAENGYIDVELDLGKNLIIHKLNHRLAALDSDTTKSEYYVYDPATGIVKIHVTSLSPFSMGYDEAVATTGGVYYTSLQGAFDEAADGNTVVLLKNVAQDNGVLFDKDGVSAKLNLNGKTFTVNKGSNINSRAIRIDNGTLEVYGGSIVAVGSGTTSSNGAGCYGAFRVEANGKLIAHDLTLTNSRPWGLNVKVCGGEAELTNVTITSSYGGGIEVTEANLGENSKKGVATLTNCTFTQTDYFDHCSTAISVSGGSEVIVNSGTYTSDNYALYVFSSGGYITVNGGTFIGRGTGYAFRAEIDTNTYAGYAGGLKLHGGNFEGQFFIQDPATANITGGTFSINPTAYVPSGYTATENNGTWTVQQASLTGTGETIAEEQGEL